MLQVINGSVVETSSSIDSTSSMCVHYGGHWPVPVQTETYWLGYPVYVCSDKTAKAIAILKLLQAEKMVECKSVPRFIELVEKIASAL